MMEGKSLTSANIWENNMIIQANFNEMTDEEILRLARKVTKDAGEPGTVKQTTDEMIENWQVVHELTK
jgi:hypothetical protein